MSKKLEQKQRRRLAEEQKMAERRRAARRRNLLTFGITIALLLGTIFLILNERKGESGPIGVSKADAGCSPVQTFKEQVGKSGAALHIAVGDTHEPYNSNPPTSGPHYAQPAAPIDTGFYTSDVEPEKVVHNMEHGQIVIWYRPNVSSDVKHDVERLVEEQPDATVAVPWDDIESKYSLVVTAWAHSQSCAKPSSEAIDEFREQFQGRAGPEAQITKPFRK